MQEMRQKRNILDCRSWRGATPTLFATWLLGHCATCKARCTHSVLLCSIYWSIKLLKSNRLSYHVYTNNILRDSKSMLNILKGYMYTENIFANISIYCHCIDIFQNILKYCSFIEHYAQSIEHPHLHSQYIARVS